VTFLAAGLRLPLARADFLPGAFRASVRVTFFAAGFFFVPFVRTDFLRAITYFLAGASILLRQG
jgi:hypothetical protein